MEISLVYQFDIGDEVKIKPENKRSGHQYDIAQIHYITKNRGENHWYLAVKGKKTGSGYGGTILSEEMEPYVEDRKAHKTLLEEFTIPFLKRELNEAILVAKHLSKFETDLDEAADLIARIEGKASEDRQLEIKAILEEFKVIDHSKIGKFKPSITTPEDTRGADPNHAERVQNPDEGLTLGRAGAGRWVRAEANRGLRAGAPPMPGNMFFVDEVHEERERDEEM